jgi:adenosylcobinamide-GDP ribazoletransferase
VSFTGALQFLTRVPITHTAAPATRAEMAPWFPVVGVVVGAVVGGVAAGLQYWISPLAAAAVAVAAGMTVTGAFHEDGLADLSDAVAGGTTRERRFEILKDPRLGTYGTAALASSIIVRIAALAGLATVGPAAAFAGAVAAHALARGVAVGVIGFAPAAANDGLGASFRSDVSRSRSAATVVIGTAIAALATGWWAGPMVGVAVLAAAVVTVVAVRAIGGVTGDVAGTVEQLAEVAGLLVTSALAARHGLWWR